MKQNLGITLLSDENKKVLKKYGVWNKVKVNGHADEVLAAVRKLQKA